MKINDTVLLDPPFAETDTRTSIAVVTAVNADGTLNLRITPDLDNPSKPTADAPHIDLIGVFHIDSKAVGHVPGKPLQCGAWRERSRPVRTEVTDQVQRLP